MDTKRLHAFAKIVDIGSITRASSILHIAQPALSQQIAYLETHFGRPLLVRSKRGVVPTEAGKLLYRHCQIILKQMDQAELEIKTSDESISGFVSVGLAPLSLGSLVATQLVKVIRKEHPGIILHINENVGGVISEMIMAGKMDVALIYNPGGIPGVSFEPVQTEELYFVTTAPVESEGDEITLAEAVESPLMLPSEIHTIRQVIETAATRARLKTNVIAQTESISVLAGLVGEGAGATILPISAAQAIKRRVPETCFYRIHKPNMKVNMAICVSGQLPLSEPATAVRNRLAELAQDIANDRSLHE
ncbi:LysR substrate-binding domain-containing protein [Primorskyibacter sedentarius]|uniref:LysR substrate-binding domain-containing protein n=1 Tax=Primorskyibacter sedentarius TaxID=745311 RepID=UPI003EB9C682